MRIACLNAGTFTEEAAILWNPQAELVPCRTNPEAIKALIERKADQAVVARENSIGGAVLDVVDPLLHGPIGVTLQKEDGQVRTLSHGLMVCGELQLPVNHCLYADRETRNLNEVQVICSHPQALAQCRETLANLLPQAKEVSTPSTVEAILMMLESKVPAVAIAPRRAAELYPRAIMVYEGVQDNTKNTTRFFVVGQQEGTPTGQDKTSLWFTVPKDDEPGTFDNVSQLLALAGVNKTLLEARPMQTELGKYVFLVDVDGHRLDRRMELVLELIVLAGHVNTLTIWGSYPRWQNGA